MGVEVGNSAINKCYTFLLHSALVQYIWTRNENFFLDGSCHYVIYVEFMEQRCHLVDPSFHFTETIRRCVSNQPHVLWYCGKKFISTAVCLWIGVVLKYVEPLCIIDRTASPTWSCDQYFHPLKFEKACYSIVLDSFSFQLCHWGCFTDTLSNKTLIQLYPSKMYLRPDTFENDDRWVIYGPWLVGRSGIRNSFLFQNDRCWVHLIVAKIYLAWCQRSNLYWATPNPVQKLNIGNWSGPKYQAFRFFVVRPFTLLNVALHLYIWIILLMQSHIYPGNASALPPIPSYIIRCIKRRTQWWNLAELP